MSEEKKACERCIHLEMCVARMSYDAVIKTWNEQYPYVPMTQDGDVLASHCKEYQTLSDIHIINKEVEKYERKIREK